MGMIVKQTELAAAAEPAAELPRPSLRKLKAEALLILSEIQELREIDRRELLLWIKQNCEVLLLSNRVEQRKAYTLAGKAMLR